MEIKNKKKISSYNNEKDVFPIQIKEIKTLYQCNTLKSFNKSKNNKKTKEEGNEHENKLHKSIKPMNKFDNGKNYKKPLSIRYSLNKSNKKSFYENNTPPKKTYYNNDNSMKNIRKVDNKKFTSSVKKEKNILNSNNRLTKSSAFINTTNIEFGNKNEKNNNFIYSASNILIENKEKDKENKGKLNSLLDSMKKKEKNNKRINEESYNIEIINDNKIQQLFRYTKKLPQKNNEISLQIKNDNIKNLKQSQMKQNSNINNNNNFIINGLNQIYKKSFTVYEDKYHNYLNKGNKNNIYPNRLFANKENLINMRIKIPIKDNTNNIKGKNDIIYVNKIKSYKHNDINNNNLSNNNIEGKKKNFDSPKTVYIPKKAPSFRGISQENKHNIKRKNMTPIYYKKSYEEEENINKKRSNDTQNIQNKNEKYFYNYTEKRIKSNKYMNNDNNYTNNKERTTYSRKTSVRKQNYCWQSNNSVDNKEIKKNNSENIQNNIIINKVNEEESIIKDEIFNNEINDISSIKLNSSYDSYNIDFETNYKYKTPNIPNLDNYFINYSNKSENKNNMLYIHKFKNNGGNIDNFNNDNINKGKEYNIKIKKYSDKNYVHNNINNNISKNEYNEIKSNQKKSSVKQNLRYINSDKKFSDKFLGNIDKNKIKNPNCYSTTIFSCLKKINNINENKNNFNKNNINYKSQKNYFNNMNKTEEKSKNKNSKFNRILKNEIISFRIDDLVVLEEKILDVLISLEDDKPAYYSCFDFINYLKNNCEIFHNLNFLIKNQEEFTVIKNGINYIIFSIILLFDFSYKKEFLNQFILLFKEIINFNYQNLIFIYKYLLDNTLLSEIKNIWELKLSQFISSVFNEKYNNTSFENNIDINDKEKINDKGNILIQIKNNINFLYQTMKIIIKNYKNKNSNILFYFLKDIHKKSSLKEIFTFFKNKILHSNGLFGYMSPNIVLKQNSTFKTVSSPFLKTISKKKYTLVLGLEDTLINFQFSSTNNNTISGILKFRPGINHFLTKIKKYFEVIVFSLYPQKIGDYLIDTIEKKEKFFDYRFFIQHSIIYDNEFVKDLKRIGRPLDKIIIVDNLPQNYRLNKKNGINIKSYWEDAPNDVALSELSSILIKIARDGGDVRDGIEKYRDEIIGKVTSKINL